LFASALWLSCLWCAEFFLASRLGLVGCFSFSTRRTVQYLLGCPLLSTSTRHVLRCQRRTLARRATAHTSRCTRHRLYVKRSIWPQIGLCVQSRSTAVQLFQVPLDQLPGARSSGGRISARWSRCRPPTGPLFGSKTGHPRIVPRERPPHRRDPWQAATAHHPDTHTGGQPPPRPVEASSAFEEFLIKAHQAQGSSSVPIPE